MFYEASSLNDIRYQSLILGNVENASVYLAYRGRIEKYQSLILGNVEQQFAFICIITPISCGVKNGLS